MCQGLNFFSFFFNISTKKMCFSLLSETLGIQPWTSFVDYYHKYATKEEMEQGLADQYFNLEAKYRILDDMKTEDLLPRRKGYRKWFKSHFFRNFAFSI